jgi:site-specific DNA-methyltransferase (adenine-specific)|tara:strand:- start:189 stop:932 length:744 start_codon:yes stop_codon:yes gene_type:complete
MSILLHGDCLELLNEVEDNSVDFIFCDLPYGQTSLETNPWDIPIDLNLLWIHLLRVKKERTPIFFTTTTKYGYELLKYQPFKCPFRYDIVWEKSISTGFLTAKKLPLRSHEMIYVFYEKTPFYDLSTHMPKFTEEEYDGEITNECNYGTIKTKYKTKGDNSGPRYDPPLPKSVIKIKSTKRSHSTEKPVELIQYLLKYFSKEGDTILDPTMGSGPVGVASKIMKRNFIGIEKNPTFYNTANNRINES